jgi:hypothetical protein
MPHMPCKKKSQYISLIAKLPTTLITCQTMVRLPGHPQVRYAACQCVLVFLSSLSVSRLVSDMSSRGQLCTDLEVRSFP